MDPWKHPQAAARATHPSASPSSSAAQETLLAALGQPLSGLERDRLFRNQGAFEFADLSEASGLDSPSDGRCAATLDFDRDGWPDIVLASLNAPAIQLFRNQVVESLAPEARPNFLALRAVGGARGPGDNTGWAPRDGYGAKFRVRVGDQLRHRQLTCGTGMGAQRSDTLIVGLGPAGHADGVEVTWPSGRVQRLGRVAAGQLVTVHERAEDTPDGSGFVVAPYRTAPAPSAEDLAARALRRRRERPVAEAGPQVPRRLLPEGVPASSPEDLRVLVLTATWCPLCKVELPRLARLKTLVADLDVELVGFPADDEPAEKLEAYREAHDPAYRLLAPRSKAERDLAGSIVHGWLGRAALPATILTDGEGAVLSVTQGTPTVSEVRGWAHRISGGT